LEDPLTIADRFGLYAGWLAALAGLLTVDAYPETGGALMLAAGVLLVCAAARHETATFRAPGDSRVMRIGILLMGVIWAGAGTLVLAI
jgi:hypothetical protein